MLLLMNDQISRISKAAPNLCCVTAHNSAAGRKSAMAKLAGTRTHQMEPRAQPPRFLATSSSTPLMLPAGIATARARSPTGSV